MGRIWVPGDGSADGHATPRYVTQRRWVAMAAATLGIAPELKIAVADGIALLLGIVGMVHRRARREFAKARCLEGRGAAIAGLLDVLEPALWPRLLTAGHRAGVWRQPHFWDPCTGQRRSVHPARASPG